MMPRSAQSSLSHCITTRPGIAAGSSGTTSSRRPAAITMPPECWPRWRGRFCTRAHELDAAARARRSRDRRPRRAAARASSSCSSRELEARATCAESRSTCSAEKPEHLAHLAHGAARAVGDDVGGHRRAALAVASVDVLDHLLALVAARAGRCRCPATRRAPRRGSARRAAPCATGIDRGDAERVADRAVGRRAAPLARGCRARGRSARCPRRSGSSRRARASRSARARARAARAPCGVIGAVALARALLDSVRSSSASIARLARRPRGSRESGSRGREAERAALGDARGVGERLREVGEAAAPSRPRERRWRSALGRGAAAGGVERAVLADAGERVEQRAVGRRGVADVVGRDHRHARRRARRTRAACGLLAAALVALDVHRQGRAEDLDQPVQHTGGGCSPPPFGSNQRPSHRR